LLSKFSSVKKLLFPLPSISKSDVEFLKQLVIKKEYSPVIDITYVLEEIIEAYTYIESGQKTGNVILKIANYSYK
jgi:hypothetical protein